MPRLGLGLGLNLPSPVWLIGGESAPIIPPGFVARYLSSIVADMTLVTGDKISQWDDQETGTPNNLTQATSGNQPTLIEYDVVKQSTLSHMPILVDTGGGVLGVDFSATNAHIEGMPDFTDEWSIEFELKVGATWAGNEELLQGDASTSDYINTRDFGGKRSFNIRGASAGFASKSFGSAPNSVPLNATSTVAFIQRGLNVEYWLNDVLEATISDQVVKMPNLENLGSRNGTGLTDTKVLSVKRWDTAITPSGIKPTPDFTLDADAQYMRNDSDDPASVGDSISAWQSTTHKPYLNEIQKTSNNKYMGGYPTQAGDFSYVYAREQVDIQAQDKRIASSSTTSAEIGFDASEQLYMVADDGTRYTWTGVINDGTEGIFHIG